MGGKTAAGPRLVLSKEISSLPSPLPCPCPEERGRSLKDGTGPLLSLSPGFNSGREKEGNGGPPARRIFGKAGRGYIPYPINFGQRHTGAFWVAVAAAASVGGVGTVNQAISDDGRGKEFAKERFSLDCHLLCRIPRIHNCGFVQVGLFAKAVW